MVESKILLLLIAILTSTFAKENVFQGSKVYSVVGDTRDKVGIVNGLEETLEGVDIWERCHESGKEARIFVPKHLLEKFETFMDSSQVSYTVIMENVEEVFRGEINENEKARKRSLENGRISFTAYHRHAEINQYLDEIASKYPKVAKVETLGKSTLGLDVKVIRISTSGGTDTRKPVIIADGGIHAREWITPAQALYMVNKLVENVTESDLVDKIDWIIVPVLNPDGYEYTHSATSNRMWRKTRSLTPTLRCPGVDANRNFDFKWMVSGSSQDPCTDIYAGIKPFSEPEVSYMRDLIEEYRGRTQAYIAIHSYGSYFLYPYGYDASDTPDNQELLDVGRKVAAAIDVAALPESKKYIVGNSAVILNYRASGSSKDYAYGVGNITLSYTLELPGGGSNGFDLPPTRIQQVVTETWSGFVALGQYIIEKANKTGMYNKKI